MHRGAARCSRRRASACDVAAGGELALALRAGFDPARIDLHGNAKSRARAARGARRRRRPRRHRQPTRTSSASRSSCPTGAAQAVLLRVTPGVRPDTHPTISTGGPTRSSASPSSDARAAIERVRASDAARPRGPAHAHRLADPRPRRRSAPAIEAIADARRRSAPYDLGGGLGVAYTDADEPPSIEDYVDGQGRRRARAPRPRRADPRRARPRARRPTRPSRSTRCESVKRNVSTWVAVDGGMSDNLRPMLYGARYEAQVADRFGGGTRVPPRRQALRVGRRDRPRRRPRRPAARRRRRHAGHRRLRPRDGQQLQRRAAPAGRVRPRRRRARRRAPRDLRRPAGARCRD